MPNRGRHEKDAMTNKAGSAAPTTTPSRPSPNPPATTVLTCPKCGGVMRTYARGGLILELCEDCRGIFLDVGELERLIDVEGGGWSGVVTAAIDPRR
jgi:Transcription factor zinc-finger